MRALQTVRLDIEVNAPLRFVFDWCTDFTEDDPKLIGSTRQRHILERSGRKVIFAQTWTNGEGKMLVTANIVTLKPPNSWHLEMFGTERNETGVYKLKRLGKEKTLIQLVFKNKWRNPQTAESVDSQIKRIREIWSKYSAALESDYRSM